MKKLLNNPFAVGVLVVIAAVIGLWPQLEEAWAKRQVRRPAASSVVHEFPSEGGESGPTDAGTLARRIRTAFATYPLAPSTRDLFAYAETSAPAPVEAVAEPTMETQSVRLGALWLQDGVSLALLDQQITATGDRIGFIDVAEISDEGVWLVHRGTRVFLHLGETHAFTQSTDPTDPALP